MIKGLSHIAVKVKNLEESLAFYREVLGIEEAFRITEDDGSPRLVYLWIAPGQFLELFPNGTPGPGIGKDEAGMQHICLETDCAEAEFGRLKALGVPLDSAGVMTGKAGGKQFWLHDPDGTKIEVMEMPPESLHVRAAEARRHGDGAR